VKTTARPGHAPAVPSAKKPILRSKTDAGATGNGSVVTRSAATKSSASRSAVSKSGAGKSTANRSAAKTGVRLAKQATPGAKAGAPAKTTRPGPGPRADLGAPIEPFFAKRTGPLRQILDQLRALIDAEVPDASSSIKWGMPFYTLAGQPVCALAAFKAHVNLILAGPEGTFVDPEGLLEGDGKTGRHLKLRAPTEIPRAAVRGWLAAAAARARGGA